MNPVVPILLAVRARLADPTRWLQGAPFGTRDRRGEMRLFGSGPSNCWCLSEAITLAVSGAVGHGGYACSDGQRVTWTELRSEVERQLMPSLDVLAPGHEWTAVYQFNDYSKTTHADVVRLVDVTIERLREAA